MGWASGCVFFKFPWLDFYFIKTNQLHSGVKSECLCVGKRRARRTPFSASLKPAPLEPQEPLDRNSASPQRL
ncbi:uncharacterized protein G2W53_033459 [Senna tora]|uniref:Uncharacterized protein n=1 Tax=Senna tora TaxID=362788 RepID=A0A834SXJ7_9FABA|nr:uncharacterized protein G2W53_033459 [Senna tora]